MLHHSKLKFFLLIALIASFGKLSMDYNRPELEKQKAKQATEEVSKPIKHVNLEQVKCLATNIYHEANGEPYMGQVAVARVVMNRIRHGFASTPCKVVYQTSIVKNSEDPEDTRKLCQFSWVCEGKTLPNKLSAKYQQAEEIAHLVLAENKWEEVLPHNTLFFHNSSVSPEWAYRRVTKIGNHIFYSSVN